MTRIWWLVRFLVGVQAGLMFWHGAQAIWDAGGASIYHWVAMVWFVGVAAVAAWARADPRRPS